MRVRYLECQFILAKNIAQNQRCYICTWLHHSLIQTSKQNIKKKKKWHWSYPKRTKQIVIWKTKMLHKTPTWKLWDMMCGLVRRALCWESGGPRSHSMNRVNHLAFPGFILLLLKCKSALDQWIAIVPQGYSPFSGLHGEWSAPHQRTHEGGERHGRVPQGKGWKR